MLKASYNIIKDLNKFGLAGLRRGLMTIPFNSFNKEYLNKPQ